MPRKKQTEQTESPTNESGTTETSSTNKPTRKRRTADDILQAIGETDEKPAVAKKVSKRKALAKPAAKPAKRATGKTSVDTDLANVTFRAKSQESKANEGTKKSSIRSSDKSKGSASEPKAPDSGEKITKRLFGKKASLVADLDGTFELTWRQKIDEPVRPKERGSEPTQETKPESVSQRRGQKRSIEKSGRSQEFVDQDSEQSTPITFERPETPAWELDDSESRVAVLLWRDKQESTEERPKSFSPRKSRSDSSISDIASEAPVAPEEKVTEEVPQHQVRQPIPRNEESAQVAVVGGHPVLIRDKKVRAPLFFGVKTTENGLTPAVIEQLKLASEHGILLFSMVTEVVVDSNTIGDSIKRIEKLMREVTEIHDGFEIILRIRFVPPSNWMTTYPMAVYTNQDREIARPSLCDDAYWTEAENCLAKIVSQIRTNGLTKTLLGVHVDRDYWVFEEGEGYDTSESGAISFRQWLRHKYTDVVTLRASWFDGSVEFDSAEVPEYGVTHASEDFVRTDRKARRWIDYNLFLSDMIVDRIGQLCYAAKQAAEGDLVTGASYGFTFEWSHPDSGHLSLGKLLRCPELDYVSGPPSYRDRGPGGSAAFPFPVDSVALNGKLYLSEDDFRTPISRGTEPDDGNPMMKTPQALEHAQRRGVGGALAHNGGTIWFDSYGNGWLNSRGIWERAKELQEAFLRRLSLAPSEPDVAMFIDERSLSYLTDPRAFEVLVQQVREAMLRSGLSVGFYLLSDLAHRENFPESRLNVFVNAWDIRPEVRSAIKSRLQRDHKVLFWLYSAGLFEGGRESLERVREATGIPLRPQPFNCKSGTTVLNARDDLSQQLPADELARGGSLEPSYFAIPEDATILGEYIHTGLPSFVIRDLVEAGGESWTSVFLGEPIVSPGLFRALALRADGHVWSYENDLVHVRAPFLTVHCSGTGNRSLMLPSKWVAYDFVAGEYMPVENSSIRFKAVDGETRMFAIGTLGDVQTYVNADTDQLRTILEPILRDENTLHWDTVKFDVKIMQLDEWVEESWSEELADDLLLKPSMLEDIDLEPKEGDDDSYSSTSGRRRRRRRKPRRDHGDQAADRAFGDQTGVSVLFRKRN